jgi:hypothetical protein
MSFVTGWKNSNFLECVFQPTFKLKFRINLNKFNISNVGVNPPNILGMFITINIIYVLKYLNIIRLLYPKCYNINQLKTPRKNIYPRG